LTAKYHEQLSHYNLSLSADLNSWLPEWDEGWPPTIPRLSLYQHINIIQKDKVRKNLYAKFNRKHCTLYHA